LSQQRSRSASTGWQRRRRSSRRKDLKANIVLFGSGFDYLDASIHSQHDPSARRRRT
jgi:hypothetical protein